MKILVDADACPVVKIIEKTAKKFGLDVLLFCDTNHVLSSDYSTVKTVSAGADAVDIALANFCKSGDIVVTQDYGVAAMVLAKGAHAIHHSGRLYTNENIEQMLAERYLAKKARMAKAKNHLKGPKKRTKEDNESFETAFTRLIEKLTQDKTDQ
ncbi:MAG: YaiI/YqxD family protein [Acutalibacteraceae bacterium]